MQIYSLVAKIGIAVDLKLSTVCRSWIWCHHSSFIRRNLYADQLEDDGEYEDGECEDAVVFKEEEVRTLFY